MSRSCGWCTAHNRRELERRVMDGEPIRLVSQSTPYSADAARRHLRNHLQFDIAAHRRMPDDGRSIASYGSRLAELADECAAVRRAAAELGDARTVLQAVGQERDTLGLLLNRLGVDSDEVLDVLRDYAEVAKATARVGQRHPQYAAEIASELREAGNDDLALTIERATQPRQQPVLTV